MKTNYINYVRNINQRPDKNDGNRIVENTFTKHKCIKVNIDMEVSEDGENCHWNTISNNFHIYTHTASHSGTKY